MAEFLVFLLIGLVVGVVARLLLPGPDPIGILGTIVVGIVGAIIGGYLWIAAFGNEKGPEWIGSILVAMILLFVYRKMTYGRDASRTTL
ncbi:MAG: GlsB/YeaQ/YmgE family stress response membrane protein [Actinobacteria bacterium]|nr:GlsB/YeaQ/YmgE family stress response membrane protein [Actinomycetota bacterium]